MTQKTSKTSAARRADCVTEVRMGNTILTVSGYFKQDATATAADKMMKVLEAEAMSKPEILPEVQRSLPSEIGRTAIRNTRKLRESYGIVKSDNSNEKILST